MNPYVPSVKAIAYTAIAIGVILYFWLQKRRYNRAVGITQRDRPLPFHFALIIGLLEWIGTWFYRLLILFGLFFLLVDWYISP